ncbi:hypothetical protein ACFDTO_25060 [Microbacteriaceae bacterium 4G12]
MKVGEIIDRLNGNNSLAVVAKQVGMSPYTLSKKLRMLGYEYDSEKKKRLFVGDGKEPRGWDISEVSSKNMTKEEIDYQKLLYDEVHYIRMMLERHEVRQAYRLGESEEKIRRSFCISRDVLEQLDGFCKQSGISKSRLVEAALIDFLQSRM